MNMPRLSTLAARLLKRSVDSLPPRPALDVRARSMATLERAFVVARRRRKSRWALGAGTFAAAAAVAVVLGHPRPTAPARAPISVNASPRGLGATFKSSDGTAPLRPGAVLRSGGRLETGRGGGALVSLSSGTRLDLAGSTAFHVKSEGATERFLLDSGELEAHVEKLRSGERFIVETPDSEVEVRGTEFHLRVLAPEESCEGTRTRLLVREGLVEVRSAGRVVLVSKGQSWPKDCDATPAAPTPSSHRDRSTAPSTPISPEALRVPPPSLVGPSISSATSARATPPAEEGRPSALTEQNELFAAALSARRRGDTSAALSILERLITRYPSSALAENAMVERMRLLSGGQQRREAARYSRSYPRGFAREEAERIGTSE